MISELNRFILENDRPFQWGKWDCFHLIYTWERFVVGTERGEAIAGAYTTEIGAARLIERGGGLQALVESILGKPRPVLQVQPGFIILNPDIPPCGGLGIALGYNRGLFVGEHGLIQMSLPRAALGWRL